jgi:uncharacterized RDD family membrane protein YckC
MNEQTSTSLSFKKSDPILLASWGQRFATILLDLVFLDFFSVFLASTLGKLLHNLGLLHDSYRWWDNDSFILNIILCLIPFLYYVPQEALSGRTLGKLITGTKAISEDGTELSFGQALGRTLCRFIPFEAFSFFGGKGRPRGWHDSIPKTKVISTRKVQVGDSRIALYVYKHHAAVSYLNP